MQKYLKFTKPYGTNSNSVEVWQKNIHPDTGYTTLEQSNQGFTVFIPIGIAYCYYNIQVILILSPSIL